MRMIIINNGSKHIRALKALLRSHKPTVVHNKELETYEIYPNDIIIISGGGHDMPILWHEDIYTSQIAILKNHKGPIIGICLGFEIISHTFGSHLHLLSKREGDKITLETTDDNLLLNSSKSIKVFESHIWSVQKLKAPLIALAKSKDGIEILRHSDRPIYGFQFHPEVSGEEGKEIFNIILNSLVSNSSIDK